MTTSDVLISNLALQKLGAKRITSLTEDSRNARSCNACYELLRDRELSTQFWNFAIKRATLTPASTTPIFGYQYAFPLPTDCLQIILPQRPYLDWKREIQGSQQVILTNQGASLNIRYVARITDPTQFDPCFVEGLACKMAMHMCEEITQSNEKKADAQQQYKDIMGQAKKNNAFEKISLSSPEDPWLTAQRVGANELNFLTFGI